MVWLQNGALHIKGKWRGIVLSLSHFHVYIMKGSVRIGNVTIGAVASKMVKNKQGFHTPTRQTCHLHHTVCSVHFCGITCILQSFRKQLVIIETMHDSSVPTTHELSDGRQGRVMQECLPALQVMIAIRQIWRLLSTVLGSSLVTSNRLPATSYFQ